MDKVEFGLFLARLRESQSLSQRKLAELSGVSSATISRIESGLITPNPETLVAIAPHLNIPVEDLLKAAGYMTGQIENMPPPVEPELRKLIENARRLSPKQLDALNRLIESISSKE
ncbi:helix-turn-helix domain-containing protein [Alicyclobacillus vulcanalis]|uniref:DNA-binding transcriptional regulator, XRE-family HTH domain n=1 Tax=Alicyclobacillus vulcanalis TaxID=252246 RepID=A0A1N7MSG0_9BACL|nr:helix-turn-helix domain-containing protein [Alicyclobacillus vulcanalis]SIS89046.1 DNA-binding transcriptional regulator, XRE-family HTH domain [Alicyclobacillus vulcanalis]